MDMTLFSTVMTVVSFVTFLGILGWAFSKRRREEFDSAANLPFELPDEAAGGQVSGRK
jgi:cytochrome c oxidase cbb3-type subunit 4